MYEILLCALVVGLFMFCAGYEFARHSIATQCERLGGFYVGTSTYSCNHQSEKETDE